MKSNTGIDIANGFNLNAPVPMDSRSVVATIEDRDTIPSGARYEGLTSFVQANGKAYVLVGGVANSNWKEVPVEDLSKLSTIDKTNLVNAVNEVNRDIDSRAINVLTLGVIGDGITDDTKAINDALALRKPLIFPIGKYRITDSIIFDNNATVYFAGSNHWNVASDKNVAFVYDGVEALDKAMFMVSKSPIGTEPTSPISNVKFNGGCLLDGSNKIGYGFYGAYLTNETAIEGLTVTNTLVEGIQIEKSWYASYRNLTARYNQGNGITIGKKYWGGINGCLIENLRANQCGLKGDFTESNPAQSYGIGFYPGSGTTAFNLVAERCYGAGVVYGVNASAVSNIDTVYLEGNGVQAKTDLKTHRSWGLIVVGHSNNRGASLSNIYLYGSVGQNDAQSVWLTGDKPTGRLKIDNMAFGQHLKADWDNYEFKGYVYEGLSQYIEGCLPRVTSPIFTSTLTTLYVRSNASGSDNNDGRTPATAFYTLAKAVAKAKEIPTITSINVDGRVEVETLDFRGLNRPIMFEGNETAEIENSIANRSLQILNASHLVEFEGFYKITRFYAANCNNLRFLNCTFLLIDNGAASCFELSNSNAFLDFSSTDGVNSTAGIKSGIRLYNSTLKLKDSYITNFTSGYAVRIHEGSVISDKTYQAVYDTVNWGDSTGYIIAGNKMKNKSGSITFA